MRRILAAAATALLLAGSATPAAAQRLIASLSNHRVMVTSSFTGAELVLFGFIETTSPRRGGYDIVATVIGQSSPLEQRPAEPSISLHCAALGSISHACAGTPGDSP